MVVTLHKTLLAMLLTQAKLNCYFLANLPVLVKKHQKYALFDYESC